MFADYSETIEFLLSTSSSTGSFTASTTQTQGQGQLAQGYTRVDVIANDDDTVTLPEAGDGVTCIIKNADAGNTLQVFPSASDKIDSEATDASIILAPQQIVWFWAYSNVNWSTYGRSIRGAKTYTASATQTQAGGTAITTEVADVSTVSTDGDAVTIFPVFFGARCWIKNSDNTQDMTVFPAVSDRFDSLATNEGIVLAANSSMLLSGVSAAKWATQIKDVSAKASFTASAVQSQGEGQLLYGYTYVSVVATDGDVVTLPTCYSGARCTIENGDAGQYLTAYPFSGDDIDDTGTDVGIPIFPGQRLSLIGVNTNDWRSDKRMAPPGTQLGISAAGTIQSTATQLIAEWNQIATSTATDNAVQLPAAVVGTSVWIHNDDNVDAVTIFPKNGASDQIDDNAVDASISLAVNATIELRAISATKWRSNIT